MCEAIRSLLKKKNGTIYNLHPILHHCNQNELLLLRCAYFSHVIQTDKSAIRVTVRHKHKCERIENYRVQTYK